jgi:hypothetical protein
LQARVAGARSRLHFGERAGGQPAQDRGRTIDLDVERARRLLVARGVGREVTDRRDALRGDSERSGVSGHDRLSARLRTGQRVPVASRLTLTAAWFQPFPFGGGSTVAVVTGSTASEYTAKLLASRRGGFSAGTFTSFRTCVTGSSTAIVVEPPPSRLRAFPQPTAAIRRAGSNWRKLATKPSFPVSVSRK